MKRIYYFISFILLILIDQGTKLVAVQNLKGQSAYKLIPEVLHFTYHENDGAVWGILSGKVNFLTIFTIIILAFLVLLFFRMPRTKHYNAARLILIFIMAGAIGNFIDRVHYGYVVDFIYFVPINFPVFNVADCYITVSAFLLIILGLFYYKDEDFDFIADLFKRKQKNDQES